MDKELSTLKVLLFDKMKLVYGHDKVSDAMFYSLVDLVKDLYCVVHGLKEWPVSDTWHIVMCDIAGDILNKGVLCD